MNNFPLSPYQLSSPASSMVPSPNIPIFPHHAASIPSPTVRHQPTPSHGSRKRTRRSESLEEEDEESDAESWDPPPRNQKSTKRPSHRRTLSANDEASIRNAKRTHTVVEKNYRERLNDKIADLAVYLFETSSDGECPSDPIYPNYPRCTSRGNAAITKVYLDDSSSITASSCCIFLQFQF